MTVMAPVDSALGGVVGVLAAVYPIPGLVRAAVDEASTAAVSSNVREGLAWLAAAVAFLATAGLSAWAFLRLLAVRPPTPRRDTGVRARSDVVDAWTARSRADARVRAAGLAAKRSAPAALHRLPSGDGTTYVHVGPRTAWVCGRRWPDGLPATDVEAAIDRDITHDTHIVYVVRDAVTDTSSWPAALDAAVRRHQHLCPLPPRPRPPLD